MSLELALLTRHGRSEYNDRGILNGDPTIPVPLTPEGLEQCRALAREVRDTPISQAVCTRFPRTQESLDIILDGRDVPVEVIAAFGDVELGTFEGRPVEEFRAWRQEHGERAAAPGGGESRIDCMRRYIRGYDELLAMPGPVVLGVVHDVTLRMMLNAVNGDDPIDGPIRQVPNAQLYRFTPDVLRRGLDVMRRRAEAPPAP